MSQGALIDWRNESDTIHNEMDRLLASGWLTTAEERQVRKVQFMALIERRDIAARNFLQPLRNASRVSIGQQEPKEAAPSVPPSVEPTSNVKIVNLTLSQQPPNGVPSVVSGPNPTAADSTSEDKRLNFLMAMELK